MSAGKSYFKLVLALACIAVSFSAMLNVFADNSEVFNKAKEVACVKGACDLARVDRTPVAQTYDFRTKQGTVSIRCTRAGVFVGEYGCTKQ